MADNSSLSGRKRGGSGVYIPPSRRNRDTSSSSSSIDTNPPDFQSSVPPRKIATVSRAGTRSSSTRSLDQNKGIDVGSTSIPNTIEGDANYAKQSSKMVLNDSSVPLVNVQDGSTIPSTSIAESANAKSTVLLPSKDSIAQDETQMSPTQNASTSQSVSQESNQRKSDIYVPPSRRNRDSNSDWKSFGESFDDFNTKNFMDRMSTSKDMSTQKTRALNQSSSTGKFAEKRPISFSAHMDEYPTDHIQNLSLSPAHKKTCDEPFELYEDTAECTLLVFGLSHDTSEIQKSNILAPYLNKGALTQWMSPVEAIVVFATKSLASTSCELPRKGSFQCCILSDMEDQSLQRSYLPGQAIYYISIEYFVV